MKVCILFLGAGAEHGGSWLGAGDLGTAEHQPELEDDRAGRVPAAHAPPG